MSKQFGDKIIEKILELKEQGYTKRQLGEQLGFDYQQIKELLKRYYRKQRKGISVSRPKGRPRCRELTTTQEKDLRIKQLEREVELYRSFLQAAGRNVRPEIKYTVIQRHAGKYPIKQMCEFFEVSRSGYYAFLKRQTIFSAEKALAERIC